MRVFPLARRSAALALVLAVVVASGARADDPSVAELQVRLVESRQQLNELYARAAAASEQLNGATWELEQAEGAVAAQRGEVDAARRALRVEQDAVAALTVQQLETGSAVSRLTTVLDGGGPQQVLERASAFASTQEAMTARIDALTARQVVFDAAADRAEEALAAQRRAVADQKAARAAIEASIARAEQAERAASAERETLLRQLAAAQDTTLEAVTERQDRIDERLDAGGADPGTVTPVGPPAGSTDPQPEPEPAPTTRPTTRPTPTPTQTRPDPPPAPPASSGKVEKAIAFARDQLGEPYKWGGAGPSSWDCSGLVMRAWQAAGVNLPHYGGAQYKATQKIAVKDVRRGDLVFWSKGSASSIYHVAMYLGDGKMIHAPRPGRSVEIVSFTYWIKPDLASRPG